MIGLCGWAGFPFREEAARSSLDRMVGVLTGLGPHRAATLIGQNSALAAADSTDPVELFHADGVSAAVVGRPGFDRPASGQLAEAQGAAAAFARGFLETGPAFVESVNGEFAAAVVVDATGQALLAVDRLGGRYPLTYQIRDGRLLFGSSSAIIRAHPQGASELDPQGIFNHLYFHVVPGRRTALKEVSRLLPGTALHFAGGRAELATYWRLDYRERETATADQLSAELDDLLRRRIRRDAVGKKVGCFLSGGTDSSVIAGLMARQDPEMANTYSIGFAASGYDEMEYARTAATHFGTNHHEYYVTADDVVAQIPRVAEVYAEPFGNASAVPAYYCARMAARDGVSRLLAGDGGDELFAGNERYAVQHVFGWYSKLPRAVRQAVLEPLLFRFPGGAKIPPIRKARSYVTQANVPMPRRMQTYNLLERLGLETMLEPEFLQAIDRNEPAELLEEFYNASGASSMLNRMLALDMQFTIADNDLPKVSRMCELAGIEVAYPLLSDELIEFATRVPPRLLLRRMKLRWFWKYAHRDLLPRSILKKKKQGFGLPFGVWLRDHAALREFAGDSLAGLRGRGVVRPSFIDQLLALHQTEHAAYYGVMIWTLMMLEQWFRAHVDRSAIPG